MGMATTEQYIYWLAEAKHEDNPLTRLVLAGLRIPPMFTITEQAFRFFIGHHQIDRFIDKQIKKLDRNDNRQIAKTIKTIQTKILSCPLPKSLTDALDQNYEQLKQLAAQQQAVISITDARNLSVPIRNKTALYRGVLKTFADLYQVDTVIQRELPTTPNAVVATIQLAPSSEKSGYTLTFDPTTEDQGHYVVKSIYGSLTPLLEDLLIPDRYLIDKDSYTILARDINRQPWKLAPDGGTKHHPVATIDQTMQKLTTDEILEVVRTTGLIENLLGPQPRQINWQFDSKGTLWVTQAKLLEQKVRPAENNATLAPPLVRGKIVNQGQAVGPVKILHTKKDLARLEQGDIAVAEISSLPAAEIINKAAGLILETGHQRTALALAAIKADLPLIIGARQASHRLKEGQLVTLDANHGIVYKGKTFTGGDQLGNSRTKRVNSPIVIATKIYSQTANSDRAEELASLDIDGLGFVSAHQLLKQLEQHPRQLIKEGGRQAIHGHLTEELHRIARAFAPRPVIYVPSDGLTTEYRELEGSEKHEVAETNPLLGYRGAFRHLQEPDLLTLELRVIRELRDNYGDTNIHLMLPYIRTIQEFTRIRHLIIGAGLIPNNEFKLWLLCQVPATLFLIDQYLHAGEIQGVGIDTDSLLQLILGVDQDNQKLSNEYTAQDEAMGLSIDHLINACHRHSIPVIAYGKTLTHHPETIERLIRNGATGVCFEPDEITPMRSLIASAEQRLLVDHAIADLHSEQE